MFLSYINLTQDEMVSDLIKRSDFEYSFLEQTDWLNGQITRDKTECLVPFETYMQIRYDNSSLA